MGACLDPTPEMGSWTVEIRSASVYVSYSSDRYIAWDFGEQPELTDVVLHCVDGGFGFPVGEWPHLVAALDQIEAHPAYQGGMRAREASAGTLRAEVADGIVRVYGPVYVYGRGEPGTPVRTIEPAYEQVAELGSLLVGLEVPTQ